MTNQINGSSFSALLSEIGQRGDNLSVGFGLKALRSSSGNDGSFCCKAAGSDTAGRELRVGRVGGGRESGVMTVTLHSVCRDVSPGITGDAAGEIGRPHRLQSLVQTKLKLEECGACSRRTGALQHSMTLDQMTVEQVNTDTPEEQMKTRQGRTSVRTVKHKSSMRTQTQKNKQQKTHAHKHTEVKGHTYSRININCVLKMKARQSLGDSKNRKVAR